MIKTAYLEKREAVFLRETYRLSVTEIAEYLEINRNLVSEWLEPYPLTKKEMYATLRSSKLRKEIENKSIIIDDNQRQPVSVANKQYKVDRKKPNPYASTSTIKKGKASESIFIARCLVNGIDAYQVMSEDGKIDVIVGPHLRRCQVKTITSSTGFIQLRSGFEYNINKERYRYTNKDIDFFIAVDLLKFDVLVLPVDAVAQYSAAITIPAMERIAKRNDMSLLLK